MVEIRFIATDEIVAFKRAIGFGFGSDEPIADDTVERFQQIFPLKTSMAAFDRDHIVATFGSFALDLTVPGGQTLPMAGTTVVTVSSTHRRKGILTDMMTRHLRQAIDLEQPLAGLWASEEQIYGRFGYGRAVGGIDLLIPSRLVTVPAGPPEVFIRPATVAEARAEVPAVFERSLHRMPGSFARSASWWEQRHFSDPEHRRPADATTRRWVIAERDGDAVGYASYRQKQNWGTGAPEGEVSILEVVADDDDGRRALWHYLTSIDLFPNVHHWNAPVDEPTLIEADRFRSLGVVPGDTLWVRLLDVARCLVARRYEADGSLVLEVGDRFLDRGGRFALDVVDGRARCSPTTAAADIELDTSDLAALYLGGCSAVTLARAGRLAGSDEAIARLGRLFVTARAPYCIEVF